MLPVNISQAGATGASATVSIAVGGIVAGDHLLGLIAWAPGAEASAPALTDYTVTTGFIVGATVHTSGKKLWVTWATPGS